METVNKLLEKVCLVTKISFKYFILKIFELLFLLGHILQPREKIKRHLVFWKSVKSCTSNIIEATATKSFDFFRGNIFIFRVLNQRNFDCRIGKVRISLE